MNLTQLKALGDGRIGGYLVPFGSPEEKDFDKEYFDASTQGVDIYFKALNGNLPAIMHHNHFRAMLKSLGVKVPDNLPLEIPVGRIDKLEKREEGWWAEAILQAVDKAHEWYVDMTKKMVNKGLLYWSSGSPAMPKSARVTEDGQILTAYVMEGTLTATPKNHYRTHISNLVSVRSALKSLNIPIPDDLVDEESTEGEELAEDVIKAMSISEQERDIRMAFYNSERIRAEEEGRYTADICDIYPNYLVVRLGMKCYRVDFDTQMNFTPRDRWIEVMHEWIPVSTAPSMKAMTDAQKRALALLDLELIAEN